MSGCATQLVGGMNATGGAGGGVVGGTTGGGTATGGMPVVCAGGATEGTAGGVTVTLGAAVGAVHGGHGSANSHVSALYCQGQQVGESNPPKRTLTPRALS